MTLENEGGQEPEAGDKPKADNGLEAKVAELEKRLEESESNLGVAKTYIKNLVEQIKANAEAPQEPRDIRERFEENPEQVLDELVQRRVNPLVNGYYKNSAESQREALAKTEDWQHYGKEVEKFMENMSDEVKAQPGSWENAMKFVKSQHLDEVVDRKMQERIAREKQAALETASPAPSVRPKKKGLSAEEKHIAEALDVSEDDYMAMRDRMISDPARGRASLEQAEKKRGATDGS